MRLALLFFGCLVHAPFELAEYAKEITRQLAGPRPQWLQRRVCDVRVQETRFCTTDGAMERCEVMRAQGTVSFHGGSPC